MDHIIINNILSMSLNGFNAVSVDMKGAVYYLTSIQLKLPVINLL